MAEGGGGGDARAGGEAEAVPQLKFLARAP